MTITYGTADVRDAERIYQLNKQLIDEYENLETIDYEKVLRWVRKKIETHLGEYSVIFADGEKAGYCRFCRNEDGVWEIDDLYVFPEFRNRGIGSHVIRKCCSKAQEPVMLYVFVKNRGAVSLYRRLGFEVVKEIHGSRYIMVNSSRGTV